MQTQATLFRASSRLFRVSSALCSVLLSASLLATVLAGFNTLADQTSTLASDSSRSTAARG